MKKTNFKFKNDNELLNSNSGPALTGLLLDKMQLKERIENICQATASIPKIPNEDIVKSMIGLLSIGKTH